MPRSTALKGIHYQLEQLSYKVAQMPTFDIHDVLDRNGSMPLAQSEHIPTSYLLTLYPEDAIYGPNYRQVLAFETAFKRALQAKLAAGYVDTLAWLRDFLAVYKSVPTSRQYTQETHEYRHLVNAYWDTHKPDNNFYGNRYKALLNWVDVYEQSLPWRERRQYLRFLALPDYPGARADNDDLLDVVTLVMLDVYQWLLQGDSYIARKQRGGLQRRHAAFMADLALTPEEQLAAG